MRRRFRRFRARAGSLLVASSLTGCGLLAGLPDWRLATEGTDGGTTEAGADGRVDEDAPLLDVSDAQLVDAHDAEDVPCDPNAPFLLPKPVSELNSSADDIGARLSADELTVYFSSNRLGGSAPTQFKIFQATRASRALPFGVPQPVPELDLANYGEYSPTMTADGLTLFFTGLDVNGLTIFVSTRSATNLAFGPPMAVPGLASTFFHPYVTPTGLHLLITDGSLVSEAVFATPTQAPTSISALAFVSTPANGFQAPVFSADRKTFYGSNQGSILRSRRGSDSVPFPTATAVPELNEPSANNAVLWASTDECRVYLGRLNGANAMDIYVAERGKPAQGGD